MAMLKVRDPADPTGNTWLDITSTGATGPSGGPVPTGGLPGQVIEKTGPADFEVGWRLSPRIAGYNEVASVVSHATVNTFVDAVTCQAHFYADRMYYISAGYRAIQDPGALIGMAQTQVGIGTVNLSGYDVITGPDTGLWNGWSQFWTKPGTDFTTTDAQLTCVLRVMLNAASKTFYSPRICIQEFPM